MEAKRIEGSQVNCVPRMMNRIIILLKCYYTPIDLKSLWYSHPLHPVLLLLLLTMLNVCVGRVLDLLGDHLVNGLVQHMNRKWSAVMQMGVIIITITTRESRAKIGISLK